MNGISEDKSENVVTKSINNHVHIPLDLLQDIRTFTAAVNNYLLTLSVVGDDIINSAKVMEKATKIFNSTDELLNDKRK